MSNQALIERMKAAAADFSREEIIEIIELAGEAFMNTQPFLSEGEVAEQTLESLIETIAASDKDSINKAKKKIAELVP